MDDVLISASDLASRLAAPSADPARPVLLDVRWQLRGPPGRGLYRDGHIPGAAFVDLESELSGVSGAGGRHPLPDTESFQRAMRRAGVSATRPVVLYDGGGSAALAAARAWWLLRYFGHASAQVLDGGFAGWLAAGHDVVAGEPDPPAPGDFAAHPGAMALLDAPGAGTLARHGVLIDARAPERFRGEVEPLDPVAGHIPGARNLPAARTVTEDGRLRDPAELRAAFAAVGVDLAGGGPVGAYCGSGVTAAHTVLALTRAGLSGALYVGSWSEWITDQSRPVATGE